MGRTNNDDRLAQALDVVLARLESGEDLAACLAAYPATARSIPRPIRLVARAVVVLALVAVGFLGVSDVAQASMPDSALYPLKLEIEDVRLGLTFDPRAQTELAMSFVVEHTDELEHLAALHQQVRAALQDQLVEELNIALSGAARVNARETVQVLTRLNQIAEAQRLRLAQITQRSTPADPQAALQVAQQKRTNPHAHRGRDRRRFLRPRCDSR
jgi:hypothetical protein